MAKLAVLVPVPRAHLTRYHGVLGPAAAWRPWIVPQSDLQADGVSPNAASATPPQAIPTVDPKRASEKPASLRYRNYSWAELMKRVFLLDVLRCKHCGGQLKILAAIHHPDIAEKILDSLGLPSRAPPLAPAIPGRQFSDRLVLNTPITSCLYVCLRCERCCVESPASPEKLVLYPPRARPISALRVGEVAIRG